MSEQSKIHHSAIQHSPNIVIVGGGMVGLSLALLIDQQQQLNQLPGSVTLIEQYSLTPSSTGNLPSFDDRSTALSAGSLEILKDLLDQQELHSVGEAILSVHISDRNYFAGTRIHAEDHQVSELGLVVGNRQLGQLLLKRLNKSSINCLTNSQVKDFKATSDGFELIIDHTEKQSTELKTNLLLIADGANSPLRRSLGINTLQKDYQQTALIANVEIDRPHNGVAFERFTGDGPMALLPLSNLDQFHRVALVWTLPNNKVDSVKNLTKDKLLRQLQQRFGFRAGKFLNIGESSYYPLNLITAEEQIRSHLVIIGNAAHLLHPVAGQGFNLALRDCHSLVNNLVKSCYGDTLAHPFGHLHQLQAYLKQQSRDQELTIGLTDQLVRLFSSYHLPTILLRQLGLLSINALPFMKKQLTNQLMGGS